MLNRIIPNLTKTPGSRRLWRHFLFGSTVPRAGYGISSRRHYAYGLYAAEDLARRPKIDKISAAKLGIAGGREVFALEAIAEKVSRALISGFLYMDFILELGMPASIDYRDFGSRMGEAFYRMDEAAI